MSNISKTCCKFNITNGVYFMETYLFKCKNMEEVDSRLYNQGLKSILNSSTEDTIYTDGVLTKAEGLSPRLLLMR